MAALLQPAPGLDRGRRCLARAVAPGAPVASHVKRCSIAGREGNPCKESIASSSAEKGGGDRATARSDARLLGARATGAAAAWADAAAWAAAAARKRGWQGGGRLGGRRRPRDWRRAALVDPPPLSSAKGLRLKLNSPGGAAGAGAEGSLECRPRCDAPRQSSSGPWSPSRVPCGTCCASPAGG